MQWHDSTHCNVSLTCTAASNVGHSTDENSMATMSALATDVSKLKTQVRNGMEKHKNKAMKIHSRSGSTEAVVAMKKNGDPADPHIKHTVH